MSKQYAHLHARAKTSVKFQNDWPKTVGVALTSQLLMNVQTDEWTGHGTPISHLRANVGAIKMLGWLLIDSPSYEQFSVSSTQGSCD